MSDSIDQGTGEPSQPLSNADIDRALGALTGWKREEGGIRKRYRRANFRDAIAFVNQIADLAEAASHHPDIDIRWRNVIVFLTTHEAGGVTSLDLELARQIEESGRGTRDAGHE
jgi:4a-hydroxytetrahydrobiopterin dehydratase